MPLSSGSSRLKYTMVITGVLGALALTVYGSRWAYENYVAMPPAAKHVADPAKLKSFTPETALVKAEEDESREAHGNGHATGKQSARHTEKSHAGLTHDAESREKQLCRTLEIPGKGPESSLVSADDWDDVLDQYHEVKAGLVAWLESHEAKFSPENYKWMHAQILDLRLQRPTTPQEPDLSWRGIGVLTLEVAKPLVRLGGGFPDLLEKDPARGRFELARLLSQVWTPAAFETHDLKHPWTSVLSCLHVDEKTSEAGWAISTAVARQFVTPGCRIPAFSDETRLCLENQLAPSPTAATVKGISHE
ncbi:MAG: hypothetical protein H7222_13770 [Methylotenera sp.]|nr:hypothetical protein [Oligoflexia bacterium]